MNRFGNEGFGLPSTSGRPSFSDSSSLAGRVVFRPLESAERKSRDVEAAPVVEAAEQLDTRQPEK